MDKKRQYLLDCGIKCAWHNKTVDEFTNDADALDAVVRYNERADEMIRKGVGLYLWGANGTGKSHLMNTAFITFIERKYRCRVFSMDDIVSHVTATWYSDEQRDAFQNMLCRVDFLGIDEFGKNVDADGNPLPLPDLVKRVIESVLRYRVQMNKPVWITSNTDPKNVRKVFSEDVGSLLNEAVISVLVRGNDYRKTVIQKRLKNLLYD